jgi:hypothetical protein
MTGSGRSLWLKIARVVRESGALPKMDWVARLKEVAGQDDYGVRRTMLQQAHLLFDEPQLRAMAESQERQAVAALATEPGDLGALDDLPRNPWVPALVLQDIAKALQDPQLYNRAVRLHPDTILTPRPTMTIVSRTDQRSQPVLTDIQRERAVIALSERHEVLEGRSPVEAVTACNLRDVSNAVFGALGLN